MRGTNLPSLAESKDQTAEDIKEIASILSTGLTYQPPKSAGWTSTPSWRFGRVYISRQTLDDVKKYCLGRLGLDSSEISSVKQRGNHQIWDEAVKKEIRETLGKAGAGPGEIQVKLFAFGKAEEELVTRKS